MLKNTFQAMQFIVIAKDISIFVNGKRTLFAWR
jgi:hypothetical protein